MQKSKLQYYRLPENRRQGLYDPSQEHSSCGVGFIVDVNGKKSRRVVDMGLRSVCKLEHRGAVGADPLTGDGSGILLQISDRFFRRVAEQERITLPAAGLYAVGFIYLPHKLDTRRAVEMLLEKVIVDEGLQFLGWRDVPVVARVLGAGARQTMPFLRQCFIGAPQELREPIEFERQLYLVRRVVDRRVRAEQRLDRSQYYVASFSSRTIVYKGMLTAEQLTDFYPDLCAADMDSALALIHQRYSTNTFPTWDLAQPFRIIGHNGEINTVRGNQNWMSARQMVMNSPTYGKNLRRMLPIIMQGQSDSATFDSVLELLYMTGRSLPHAMMMMIPEAWSKKSEMDPQLRAFYEYHATMMESWDGPAAIAFTDGELIGATLDRNGLRPGRYVITKDNLVIMASEVGTVDIDPKNILENGRLRPGRMFLVDLRHKRIIGNEAIKQEMAQRRPYAHWVEQKMLRLSQMPDPAFVPQPNHKTILERQRAFGYTSEDLVHIIRPMAIHAQEPIGSMGADAALAILSERPNPLFRYFKQQFAQVTNPAIDPIREEMVMELTSYIGAERNLLDETAEHAQRLELEHPVLANKDLEKIRSIKKEGFQSKTINILFDPDAKHGMRIRLDQVCEEVMEAVRQGYSLVILSDRGVTINTAPIPSLLALSAVHHSLIRAGLRTKTGLIVESGEPREVTHFALLLGFGANAVNPYLILETLADMIKEGYLDEVVDFPAARANYIQALGKGLLKIFSKMGISTLQSYCGAQIFEAIGLDSELVDNYFSGAQTLLEGLSLEMLEEETLRRHQEAFDPLTFPGGLHPGGLHFYRRQGLHHLMTPLSIHQLRHSSQTDDYQLYRQFAQQINEQKEHLITLRALLKLETNKKPLPLQKIEPEEEIIKRFVTGAMSFGAISWETHTDLAIAMNRIGGRSNTGEGGEDPIRFIPKENGDSMRSAIKQVASGRFGVTTNYLVNADDIQIKISQGAKPGEGGQLPGHKVDRYIAQLRFSTPGVTLISPPPHHDIYSIEDIKQLIFDLKNVNPKARISVKLVSEMGVGTVASGVVKAHADHILISGDSGGTGASPVSSIQHAGTPWELGLSETHQTLVINGLRDRVCLEVDGKILTGRDVVIGALLGADEFGFSMSPLIALGCIMMRKCHLNTCPVGIATQDPILRAKYAGQPQYVVNYMRFVAREVRELMAQLGFQTFNEMIGQADKIHFERPRKHWKARGLDFSRVLHKPPAAYGTKLYCARQQQHSLDRQLDLRLIEQAEAALLRREPVKIAMEINNINRSLGAMLSGEVARHYGEKGLPAGTIQIDLHGIAGQSFGAFLMRGIQLTLCGQANDYVGKGLCGGLLIISTPPDTNFDPAENIIIGNTCLYGATGGEAYFEGVAGERFCIRNSGAYVVAEGVGDHGCEYMTGGRVVILGNIGRNFAAGMSGGIAYLWDPKRQLANNINGSLVDLETLESPQEIDECLHLVTRHFEYTGSKRAGQILKNWPREIGHFIKVIPRDYKQALAKLAQEERQKAVASR